MYYKLSEKILKEGVRMRAVIITVAGISSRFNEGVSEAEKELKAIYTESDRRCTLLYHLLKKCSYADRIIIVGGYKFDSLKHYCFGIEDRLKNKIELVYNEHYKDLSSGYSLYLGLQEAFKFNPEEILFVEGDLNIDAPSFERIVNAENSVLTYTYEPIHADKAVVLYIDDKNQFRYAFNSSHGLLSIDTPFSCILNSGQTWKFTDVSTLRRAAEKFYLETKDGTNLCIIQNYLDSSVTVELIALDHWTNCNTKDDYRKIAVCWEEDK